MYGIIQYYTIIYYKNYEDILNHSEVHTQL